MASQSLYRKWRSQTFSDLVGQEPVIRTLKNALKAGNLAHAYLFTGPRGTGKTSTARLLAKTINCPQAQNGEPCNVCQQCREITAGNSFNVMEIDAASNRGIDSIRELREKVMVPPSTGKYKVYILDEAHMLTVEAFNALLKTLEEPPAHAIFVMATTDVHKMLPTVLSRCQRFDFKRITTRQIVEHLCFVSEREQVKLERGAAELIARAAAGGMRDALSLLDQAIAYAGQEIALTQVQAMLGVADPRAIQKFILHIAHLDSSAGLHLIHELTEAGADLRQINTQIAEYWRAMMLSKAGANISEILDSTEEEVREIAEVARLFALEELIECARVFAQNDLMQKNQGTPQLGLELALLACVELHRRTQAGESVLSVASAPSSVARPAQASQSVQSPRPISSQVSSRVAEPNPSTSPRIQSSAQQETRTSSSPIVVPRMPSPELREEPPVMLPNRTETAFELDERIEVHLASVRNELSNAAAPVANDGGQAQHAEIASAEANDSPSITLEQVQEKWADIKRRVRTKKDGAIVMALLKDYSVVGVEGTSLLPVVVIKASSDFHYKSIQKSETYQKLIEWALKIELERESRVRLLSPTQTVPAFPPPMRDTSNHSINTRLAVVPQQSAHLERPVPEGPPSSPLRGEEMVQQPDRPGPVASMSPAQSTISSPTLTRMSLVKENSSAPDAEKSSRTTETRQGFVEKKAQGDPVVQEVVRMFKAQIKDVHLK